MPEHCSVCGLTRAERAPRSCLMRFPEHGCPYHDSAEKAVVDIEALWQDYLEERAARMAANGREAAWQARAEEAERALVLWKQVAPAIRKLRGYADDWPDPGNEPLAVTASYALLLKERDALKAALERRGEILFGREDD